ncbi:MAG TPA: S53 family peptidase [Steroidobacteraceae bacterium]|jgi:kumamolisin|nr:S53 family peptidase [Steroidobacteraceae bacterium]
MQSVRRVKLAGSERSVMPGARVAARISPEERFEVTVRLRPGATLPSSGADFLSDRPVRKRRYLSRASYVKKYGTRAADFAKLRTFAKKYGLVVVAESPARHSSVLSGTAAAFSAAFAVTLQYYTHPNGSFRGRVGPIRLPQALAGIVQGVFGLDNRPQASAHFQLADAAGSASKNEHAAASFTAPVLAQLYNFPTGLDGSGQCIGLIELGGGFRPADIDAYFQGLGIAVPTVTAVSVDHGANSPTTASGPDGEVMLDIEVAAAIAPNAKIAVYFTANTSRGFLDAITTALHDTQNKPAVISISWGGPEAIWTGQALQQFDAAFQTAAALGVSVCVAAGDSGSADGENDQLAHVDFPASSPHVLACGGTSLTASGTAIDREVVWNDGPSSATGGGISDGFALPSYQSAAHVPPSANPGSRVGRGVPDVAGDADPATGYQVRVDGENLVFGGTSAVAPLWAGLIALCNQKLGTPVGFLNPLLYGSLAGKGLCRDITSGNNGAYSAAVGWDACSGWGSPDGAAILQALEGK